MESVKDTAEKIRNLEVKGARNAAIAAVKALQTFAYQTKAIDKKSFLVELEQAQRLLFDARETEPLLRNALHYLVSQVKQSGAQKISEICALLIVNADNFLTELDASRTCAAEFGSELIQNGMTIFTHCHSSTVSKMLIHAKQAGKNFKVICTETRPTFQGRVTARELIEKGIETTFIIDSATQAFILKADFIVVGADAITFEGNVVNKIGTCGLAILAHAAHKPFYIVSELLKFDSTTFYSGLEGVEQRSPVEIWIDAPKNLDVRNPAFDVTPSKYIYGLICEKGIISPKNIFNVIQQFYPWLYT
ncbi:MAG: S-methyl-5-thioribose-1-phosphate isomerase [Candidatus Bathyarchaeota archaeon]|uniref:translation initiation factor eIF-2B n=1 Tax=Candidatus Bathycorpusculum sp. TaxID=2994959 RepID=UPI002826E47B|nr:S-methyl-5-thioribose-1-phosphate isomerase [Candidatus Termiticorpusculum sp.]MCL2257077.1 S-methyl-5-thioribose-1-phosphate isomerase [Candidatus Termiticorpusculum sp.]MCL2292785.1 S-methyl-5-thioribose-1-phosphate isomerase [Candidatus Termiticorpusculum sp.]